MRMAIASLSLAVAGCLAYPAAVAPKLSAETIQLECAQSGSRSFGTLTVVGETELTAKHVATLCPALQIDYISDLTSDYAIVRAAPLPSCKDAEVGEEVIYEGYPGTTPGGYGYLQGQPFPKESDAGTVKRVGIPILAFSSSRTSFGWNTVDGITEATMTRVRPGYSGGAVMSAKDGRLVGIINAVNRRDNLAYFTPVSTICSKIEEITHE